MSDILAKAWAANRDDIDRSIALLRAAGAAPDDEPAREQAQHAAHKLAGSLGMFGLRRASELAAGIEDRLAVGGTDRSGLAASIEQLVSELP